MAASKKFEMILDLVVNFGADEKKLAELAIMTQKVLEKSAPEIKFSPDKFKNEIKNIGTLLQGLEADGKSIEDVLSNMTLDIDMEKAEKEFAMLLESLKDIDNIDLAKLEQSMEGLSGEHLAKLTDELQKAFDNIDTDKFEKEITSMAKEYEASVAKVSSGLSTQKSALKQMEVTGQKGSEAYKKLQEEIKKSENELKKLGVTLDKPVTFFDKMAKFGLAANGIQQVTQAFNQFIQPYKEFDRQLKNIGTLGVTNFEDFRDAAIDIATKVPDTVAGVTEGIYNAISAGAINVVDGVADIAGGMEFIEQSSKLAVAGLTDTNAAVKSLAAATNAYGTDVLSAGKAADILFGTVKNGVTTVPELNAALSNVVPIAAAAGVSFDQVGAAIATLTKQGVPTAQATTQIRQAIVELMKPGENLKKVMTEAGVSIESLQKEGLQESMRKIGVSMNDMGLDAANTFSSVEAIQFALSQTGDNAKKAASDLLLIGASAGSVEQAFAIANEGIGVQTQGILNQVEAMAFKLFGVLGDQAVVLLDSANSLAPLATAFAGIGSMIPEIPEETKERIGEYAKSLKEKLFPATVAAEGAQKSLTMAILTNPYIIAAAAIAALVIGVRALSDAMHESAVERQEALVAEVGLLDSQIEMVANQKKMAESSNKLVEAFEGEGESAMENRDLMLALAKTYPGVISSSKSYAENLAALQKASGDSSKSLGELQTKMDDLQDKKFDLESKTLKIAVEVQKEELENLSTDFLTAMDSSDVFDILGGATYLPIKALVTGEDIDFSAFEKVGSIITEFLFGTSDIRKRVEEQMKTYTDEIFKASTSGEIADAAQKMAEAVYNGEGIYGEMDPTQQAAIIKGIEDTAAAAQNALKARQTEHAAYYQQLLEGNYSEEEALKRVGIRFNVNKEKAKEIVDEQKKQVEKAKETAKELEKVANSFSNIKKAAQTAFDEGFQKELDLIVELEKAKKEAANKNSVFTEEARKANVKRIEEQIKNQVAQNKESNKEFKNLTKIEEARLKAYNPEPGESWLSVAKRIYDNEKQLLDNASRLYELDVRRDAISQNREQSAYDEYRIALNTVEVVKQQQKAYEDALIQRKVLLQDKDGGLTINPRISQADQDEVEQTLKDFKYDIQDKGLNIIEINMSIDKEAMDIARQLEDLQLESLKAEIEIGVKGEDNYDAVLGLLRRRHEEYKRELESHKDTVVSLEESMQGELSFLGENASKEQIASVKAKYGDMLNEAKNKQIEAIKNERSASDTITGIVNDMYDKRMSKIDEFYDKERKKVEKNFDVMSERLAKYNDDYSKFANERLDAEQQSGLSALDDEKNEKLKLLESYADLELQSTASLEERKLAIEEEYRKKRADAEEDFAKARSIALNFTSGKELELTRVKELKLAELESDGIKERIAILESKRNEGPLSLVDEKALEGYNEQLAQINEVISNNADIWSTSMFEAGDALSSMTTALIAGNADAAVESLRDYFSKVFGMAAQALSTKISETVLSLVLDWLKLSDPVMGMNPIAKALMAPVIYAGINAGVSKLAGPILSGLKSFASGGRIDGPTALVAGDASKLGGRNREWWTTDPQLIGIMQSAIRGSNQLLEQRLRSIENLLENQVLTATLSGENINLSQKRTKAKQASRARP